MTPPFILAGEDATIHAQRIAKLPRVVSTKVTRAGRLVGVADNAPFVAVSPGDRLDDLVELAVPERVARQAQEMLATCKPEDSRPWLLVYQDGYISLVPDDVFNRDYSRVDPIPFPAGVNGPAALAGLKP